jgi:hypothetical protein
MLTSGAQALVVAGSLSALAGAAHLACILVGAPAYRFMGAGEKMVRSVEAGKLRPTLITLAIAGVLFVWAAYAFAGAGVIGHLPLTKILLPVICTVYLGRALALPLLKRAFPGNSQTFWLASSGVCLGIGLVHAYGIASRWPDL